MKDKLIGLAWALAFSLLACGFVAVGYRIGKSEGMREADLAWATAMVRRHIAYWEVWPNGSRRLRIRYAPKVRDSAVVFVDEHGNEIRKNIAAPIDTGE